MGQLKELQPLPHLIGKGFNFSETEPFFFLTPELLCLSCSGTEDTLVFFLPKRDWNALIHEVYNQNFFLLLGNLLIPPKKPVGPSLLPITSAAFKGNYQLCLSRGLTSVLALILWEALTRALNTH